MFDLNAIVSAAISAAITEATKPLLERIATLESANDILHKTQHEDMVAMRDRITALEDQAIVTSNAVDARITALETKLTEAALFTQTSNVTIPIDEAKMVEALNSQEWFWEKMRNFTGAAIEEAMDDHTSTYDHDSYDNAVSDLEDRDFVTNDNLEDAVRDAIGNLTFEVSVS